MKSSYDPEETWEGLWKDIIFNPDGTMNMTALKKELSDYQFVADQAQKVYKAITLDKVDNIFTLAEEVIEAADDAYVELQGTLDIVYGS